MAFPGHWAPNALLFYTGNMFPAKYKNGAFIAPVPVIAPDRVFAPLAIAFTTPLLFTPLAKVSPVARLTASVPDAPTVTVPVPVRAEPSTVPLPICKVPAFTAVAPV